MKTERLYERTFEKADTTVRKALLLLALLCAWLGAMVWASNQQAELRRLRAEQAATVAEMVQGVLYMKHPISEE